MSSLSITNEFNFKQLLKFALPSVFMMVFIALYTIIDGFFVARFVGEQALAAINFVYPVTSVSIAIGVMFATGGSAVVAKLMGEGKRESANHAFSFIVIFALIVGVIYSLVTIIFIDSIIAWLEVSKQVIEYAKVYMIIIMVFAPMSVIQILFQNFFVAASRPMLGLVFTLIAGLSNIILDYVFIVPLNMGIAGAAVATSIGFCIPSIGGVIFFFKKNNELSFNKPIINMKLIGKSCFNGLSEMVNNLAGSIIIIIFNFIMVNSLGVDGVAAVSVAMYCNFLMTSLVMGFSVGVAPIFSYNYGARKNEYQKRLFFMCSKFVLIVSVGIFLIAFLFHEPIVGIFLKQGSSSFEIGAKGLKIFSWTFLFAGINIFASALFTSLHRGKISAAISFMASFFFVIAGLFLMISIMGVDGVWLSMPFANIMTTLCILGASKKLRPIIWRNGNELIT